MSWETMARRAASAGGMLWLGWPGPQACWRWQRRFAAAPLMINYSLEVPARITGEQSVCSATSCLAGLICELLLVTECWRRAASAHDPVRAEPAQQLAQDRAQLNVYRRCHGR